MTHIKLAELTSGVGALVLGVGLGGLFPQWIGPAAGLITVVGLSLHAFGMWNKHRLEALGHAHNASWVVALYWVCWLLLAGVLALLLPLTDCMATVTPSPMHRHSRPSRMGVVPGGEWSAFRLPTPNAD